MNFVFYISGPNSRNILKKCCDFDFSDENFPVNSARIVPVVDRHGNKFKVRMLRVSFVGELGYEMHIPKESCEKAHRILMRVGGPEGLKNSGYRSMYSLSSEKGYHLWGSDLRSDDTPVEANLGFTCRKNGIYKGKNVVHQQQKDGIHKRLVFLSLKDKIPLWGLETVYRNGEIVGHLRRGEWAHTLNCAIGQSYIKRVGSGLPIDVEYIKSGSYQIESLGKLYDAEIHLRSPFDPKGLRIQGIYN